MNSYREGYKRGKEIAAHNESERLYRAQLKEYAIAIRLTRQLLDDCRDFAVVRNAMRDLNHLELYRKGLRQGYWKCKQREKR